MVSDVYSKHLQGFLRLIGFSNRLLAISIFLGILIGLSSGVFLVSLHTITHFRMSHRELIYALPIIGLIINYVYLRYGSDSSRGIDLILNNIQNNKGSIPILMAPLVYIGTLLTHLVGGSAGREGTALQMAAGMTEMLKKFFQIEEYKTQILLKSAVASGFGSVFGTPIAGIFFAFEFIQRGKIDFSGIFSIVLTTYIAFGVTHIFPYEHTNYEVTQSLFFSWKNLGITLISGLSFGFAACFFVFLYQSWKNLYKKLSIPQLWTGFIGGVLILLLTYGLHTDIYLGLGIETIQASFHVPLNLETFAIKTLMTTLTIASGFKGGEVTPLFFIGASLGNALSIVFHTPHDVMAAMGFVSVFAAATNTRLACILMSIELFGLASHTLWIALSVMVAYWISGKSTIYQAQTITR
ncbi:MAG: chloride channel protein [Chitinophagales bacterium]|jgi:H+/Cl- antiporter ClcA|nr:chloride channel protein [Chitinophagales bacterium]